MGSIEVAELPKDLCRGHNRFSAWRAGRSRGSRIPQSLWALAARLARTYGVSRAATVLGVDYYALKRRAEAAAGPDELSNPSPFIELPVPLPAAPQALFEFDNGAGTGLRLHLTGYAAADLAILVESFWNAD